MDAITDQVVDEFVIEARPMPGTYAARLAIRYQPESSASFVAAIVVADAFIKARYHNYVRTGLNGSPNGDALTIYFHASAKKDGTR